MKAERSEPGLEEESNFGLEGGGKKYERTLSAYARPAFYPQPPGFLFAARVFIWEAPALRPHPGLMWAAEAPTMETVCAL